MSNPQTETKIELVTEAIEGLVVASVVAFNATDETRNAAHKDVLDCRTAVSDALRHLLQPTLRIVQTKRDDTVGEVSRTLTRTVVEDSRMPGIPYGGKGIDGMDFR